MQDKIVEKANEANSGEKIDIFDCQLHKNAGYFDITE